ncbi:MAG: GNAT family N-acetyltransferase [Candidatus Berkiella sp.]
MLVQPELIALKSNEFSIIEPLALYYEYDMSRYCGRLPGWEFPVSGNYLSKSLIQNLKSYFSEKNRYPFLIRVDEHPAGFVMVNTIGTTAHVQWNMGEFFVLAPYQRCKIGQTIAKAVFERFMGEWEVAVIPQNTGALHFWKGVIHQFTNAKFSQEKKLLTKPENHQMIIFSFESKEIK